MSVRVERPPIPPPPELPEADAYTYAAVWADCARPGGSPRLELTRATIGLGLASLPELGATVAEARRLAADGARAGADLFRALADGEVADLRLGALMFDQAWSLAAIARDDDARSLLRSIDLEVVRRASHPASPHLAWVERLIGGGDRASLETPVLVAAGALLDAIRGGGDLDRAIVAALEAHRAYASSPRHATEIAGFVALRVLGLVCEARDRGAAIGVESPYLPRGLVEPDIDGATLVACAGGSR